MLLEVMKIGEEIGSKPVRRSALEVCAGLAAAREHWLQAAQLFGVAEAQREQTKLRRDPADQAFLDPLIARARQALGHQTFASAEEQGRTLPLDAALAQARERIR